MDMDRVRIGVLGAARIVPGALTKPAKTVGEAEVVAIAARDPKRALAFATKHGIGRTHESYDSLLADPDIDAVYNPLPNGLHAEWTIKALEAGKHVLCEKPFTANAAEAEVVAAAADRTGLVVMEAFHWRYHPLPARVLEIIASGEIGQLRRVEAAMAFPLFKSSDIRWQLDLAGGALMDAGCYAVHQVRTFAQSEPEVVRASAKLKSPGVDRVMDAELRFANGVTGHVFTSMWSSKILSLKLRVAGDSGEIKVFNPTQPQLFHRFTVQTPSGKRREKIAGKATYWHQLVAFCGAVLRGEPTLTPPSESVANMRAIDAIYRAAGMQPRPSRLG
jgi:predicted dehydrogenase